jgi:hypothetical protein
MILVTGDVVLDHNIYAGQRQTPVSTAAPGTRFDKQPGGAMLTFGLLRQLVPGQVEFGLGNVSVAELEGWPGTFHAGGLWEPASGIWRLSKHLGYGAPRAGTEKLYPGAPASALDKIKPKVLVIDDGGLGFRHRTASGCWPPVLNSPPAHSDLAWIVLKMSRPLARGDLWRDLSSKWHQRLIVVVSADNLRTEDARISKGLSWESTVDDIVDEVQSNPALRGFQSCRHLIVTLRGEAALWFDQSTPSSSRCRLIFDREYSEGESEGPLQVPGGFGFLSAMTASVAWRMWEVQEEGLTGALQAGLSTTRFLRSYGHGPIDAAALASRLRRRLSTSGSRLIRMPPLTCRAQHSFARTPLGRGGASLARCFTRRHSQAPCSARRDDWRSSVPHRWKASHTAGSGNSRQSIGVRSKGCAKCASRCSNTNG